MPLSVKSFTGGAAHYKTAQGRHIVSEGTWLILNDQEPYTIDFQSKSLMRSTVVFFPTGWAERVARANRERQESLLDEPEASGEPVEFLQTVVPDDARVAPLLRRLDGACRGAVAPEAWLEEQLHELLAALMLSQGEHRKRAARLPAARPTTRAELYRRLCRGREFLHAHALAAPTLAEAAQAANLSAFHFQRSFKTVFGVTPHGFVAACRLDRARQLLEGDSLPATEIAAAVGYDSYSAFHAAYRRRFGVTPSQRR